MTTWNPRYVAYAAAHGCDPETMLAEDAKCYPGGRMAGFMQWIGSRWEAWRAANGRKHDEPLAPNDHASFDAWLSGGASRS